MGLIALMGREPDVNEETKSGHVLKWKFYDTEQLGLEMIVSSILFQNQVDREQVQKIEIYNVVDGDSNSGMACFYVKEN